MSHNETLEKELRKYASDYITREASRMSLITITRCELSSDGKRALISISILPEAAEPIAMDFLKRHQDNIRQHIQKNSRIQRVPWLRFTLDKGEKNRQRVDILLQEDK